ncbi:MAG: transcription termination/antitermination protein NusA, partial [Clostridia bacterium]|nr:transcription termination/antitermination protein NusA [Clostridia bacterium]
MNLDFVYALREIEREKGVSLELLLEALEAALLSAYKKNFGSPQNARVDISPDTGEVRIFVRKTVVEQVHDPKDEMSLEEAQAKFPGAKVGDELEVEVTPKEFGRIAAQTAKQVVVQRIREAERSLIYEEYANREDDIVTGSVQRQEM